MTPQYQSDAVLTVSRSRVADFVSLTKPELTFLSVLTALGGSFLAGIDGKPGIVTLLHVMIGTLLVGGGAGALNQFMERSYDALMNRTKERPIPSGRISPGEGFLFGTVLSASGVLYLLMATNLLTACLALITIGSYLFLYTPMKRISWTSTLIGGIPGALPPVMGWTAVQNEISIEAGVLFAILFFWQMPHFFSLAWMYRDDYRAGGFQMLTVLDPDGKRTALQIVVHSACLLVTTLLLAVVTSLGSIYLIGSGLLGLVFLICGIVFATSHSNVSSRRVFFASLAYLPVLLALIVLDRI